MVNTNSDLERPGRGRFRPWMRIRSGADFQRVYREGNRARGACFTIAVRPNGTETTRLGLSIGKRVWKSAVRRNRVRRLAREAFRQSYDRLPRGLDVVVIGSVPKVVPELESLREELVKSTEKAYRRWLERNQGEAS